MTIKEWLLACSDTENFVALEDDAPWYMMQVSVCDTVFNLLYSSDYDKLNINMSYPVLAWNVRNDGVLVLNYDSTM